MREKAQAIGVRPLHVVDGEEERAPPTEAHQQLAAIDVALGKLTAGQYGICERCGQPIGAERLAARPAAQTCIRCAAKDPR